MILSKEINVEELGKILIKLCFDNNVKTFKFKRRFPRGGKIDYTVEIDLFDSQTEKLVMKPCSHCKQIAVFTREGPNDEYPEPLCKHCEENL